MERLKNEYLIKRITEVIGYMSEYFNSSDIWDYIQAVEILENLISELNDGND